jgi:hypothetical protein
VLVAVDPNPCADGGCIDACAGGSCVDACAGGRCADACPDGSCYPPTLLNGLVGYWRFDDGTGSATARDDSGNANTGTLQRLSPTTAWVPGKSGGGIGIYAGGWVGVVDSTSIDAITSAVTVTAWVYFDGVIDSSMYGTAISRQVGTGVEQHYHLSLFNGHPHLFVRTVNGTANLSSQDPNPVAQRTWTHLAGTYDGATVRLYVDGAELANVAQPLTGNLPTDTTPIIIGGNGNDASGVPTELFPGSLDEIMLYRRALSAAEIAELYAGALFPTGPTD